MYLYVHKRVCGHTPGEPKKFPGVGQDTKECEIAGHNYREYRSSPESLAGQVGRRNHKITVILLRYSPRRWEGLLYTAQLLRLTRDPEVWTSGLGAHLRESNDHTGPRSDVGQTLPLLSRRLLPVLYHLSPSSSRTLRRPPYL